MNALTLVGCCAVVAIGLWACKKKKKDTDKASAGDMPPMTVMEGTTMRPMEVKRTPPMREVPRRAPARPALKILQLGPEQTLPNPLPKGCVAPKITWHRSNAKIKKGSFIPRSSYALLFTKDKDLIIQMANYNIDPKKPFEKNQGGSRLVWVKLNDKRGKFKKGSVFQTPTKKGLKLVINVQLWGDNKAKEDLTWAGKYKVTITHHKGKWICGKVEWKQKGDDVSATGNGTVVAQVLKNPY